MELQAVRANGHAPGTPSLASFIYWPDEEEGTEGICFELVEQADPDALAHGPVPLAAGEEYLLRCDRVDFPPGGVAYLHTHQGPGVRVLVAGSIVVSTNGSTQSYAPGEGWFEAGPDPVFAAASESGPSAFVRCMVLPRRLLGQSSLRYVREEDAGKPKPQRYRVFVDEPLELGVRG